MTEQNPFDEPATDGAQATEFPVVAGAGQTFDDLDSDTPLSTDAAEQDGGSSENGSTGEAGEAAADPGGG